MLLKAVRFAMSEAKRKRWEGIEKNKRQWDDMQRTMDYAAECRREYEQKKQDSRSDRPT